MSLLEQLKKDRIDAMKTHYKAKTDLLGVILGEATKQTKEPSDDMILKVLKNNITTTQEVIKTLNRQLDKINETESNEYLDCAEDVLNHMNRVTEIERIKIAITASVNEVKLLTPYLPVEVSVFEIREFVAERKLAGDDFGKIMKASKIKWGQSVDMKLVTQIAKE